MKKQIISILFGSSIIILSFPGVTFAAAVAPILPNQIRVTGVVPDRRVIIVDQNLNISQVYSNTFKNIPPVVLLNSLSGAEIPLSASLEKRYEKIMQEVTENKIVSITSSSAGISNTYPDFVSDASDQTLSSYTVKPTATPAYPERDSYLISS